MAKPVQHISITMDDLISAYESADKNHSGRSDDFQFGKNWKENLDRIYDSLKNHEYVKFIHYSDLVVINNNGKNRKAKKPSFETLILQHLFVNKARLLYDPQDPIVGYNCKPGFGINSKVNGSKTNKSHSVVHRVKHLVYDRTNLYYFLSIDQRKCYDHVSVSVFRKQLKRFTTDKWFIDFAVNVCFVHGLRGLPIGTPSSPMAHHIVMADFDHYVSHMAPFAIRYADNVLLAFETKEEANVAKWRIKNYWWYVLKIRSKRNEVYIGSLDKPFDFVGYKFHRNNISIVGHNKGYTTVRDSTLHRLYRVKSEESYASYFGILACSDSYNILKHIENAMKLSALTENIRINREMDAPVLDIKNLVGHRFNIEKYEIRRDKDGVPNWIKCLISFPEVDEAGYLTNRICVRVFHGYYKYIIQYIVECEKQFPNRSFLPIEDCEVEENCGFILKGSTNMAYYLDQMQSQPGTAGIAV